MKKRMMTLLLIWILCMALAVPAWAAEGEVRFTYSGSAYTAPAGTTFLDWVESTGTIDAEYGWYVTRNGEKIVVTAQTLLEEGDAYSFFYSLTPENGLIVFWQDCRMADLPQSGYSMRLFLPEVEITGQYVINGTAVDVTVIGGATLDSVLRETLGDGYQTDYGTWFDGSGQKVDLYAPPPLTEGYVLNAEDLRLNFKTSTQLYLVEPWAFKANTYVLRGDRILTAQELEQLDYGFLFITGDDLGETEATAENIAAHEKTVRFDKDATRVETIDGRSRLSASYDKGIYTYELGGKEIYVTSYVDDGSGRQYTPVRKRNLLDMVRQLQTQSGFSQQERAVYLRMEEMHETVAAHRAKFPEIPVIEPMTARKNTGGFSPYAADLKVKHSTQVVLIEPWGLQVNGYVEGEYADYGVILSKKAGTLEELLADPDAYVFSVEEGSAVRSGTKVSALYNEGIYTHALDTDLYVVFYARDCDGVYHFGEVKNRNILKIVSDLQENEAFAEDERAVYRAMVRMFEDITAYRKWI